MADAKVLNKRKILARLNRMPASVAEVAAQELKRQVDALAEAIRRAAPVQSGALHDSIRVLPGHTPISYRVEAGGLATTVKIRKGVRDRDFLRAKQSGGNHGEFDYARAVEFGHLTPLGVHVPANPFFFPVYRARKSSMTRAIRAAVRRRLKQDFPEAFRV